MQTCQQFQSRAARLQYGFRIHLTGFPVDALRPRFQPVRRAVAAQADSQHASDAATIQTGADIRKLSLGRVPKQVRPESAHLRIA